MFLFILFLVLHSFLKFYIDWHWANYSVIQHADADSGEAATSKYPKPSVSVCGQNAVVGNEKASLKHSCCAVGVGALLLQHPI